MHIHMCLQMSELCLLFLLHAYAYYGPAKLRDSIRIQIGCSDSIRFDSDGPIRKVSNGPRLPIARSSQTTQTINGA